MIIELGHYLILASMLFTIGVIGVFLNRKNVIIILMSLELILLSISINLVACSSFLNDSVGQISYWSSYSCCLFSKCWKH